MNKFLSVLLMFSFSFFSLHAFCIDESTECLEDASKKIPLEGKLADTSIAKSLNSEQVEVYLTDDNLITIQFNIRLISKDIHVTVKNVNSAELIIDETFTMDCPNIIALPFGGQLDESYLIEVSQENGYVYGYF